MRRWLRRLGVFIIIVAGLLVAAWYALTSSWFLAPRIESLLSDLVGGRVTVGSASLTLDGQLHLTDVRVLVPSVRGPAGELLHVPDVAMNLDRDEILAGRLVVQDLAIDDALLRLSEDLETGKFNIGGLIMSKSGAPSPTMIWPRVELRSGVVQMGEHRGSAFVPSGELRVNGSLRADRTATDGAAPEWYSFDLWETAAQGETHLERMRIAGRFNVVTAEGSSILSGVSFEPERAKLLPRVAREWWKTIDPSGSLEPIGFQLNSDGRYEIEIAMDGIDWSLPVPSFDPRRDTDAPRMTNVRGSVVIHDGVVDLIGLSGEIDTVRYGLTGSFLSVDRSPGFDLTFDVERFDLSRNMNVLTALPNSVRELVDNQLIQLGGPTGLLDARVTLRRAPSERTESGEETDSPRQVRASGRVELLSAEGSYRAFPYPLSGLTGAVEFNDEEVRIVALAGRGPTGAQIFVSGRVSPLGPNPQVDVELYAIDVPIDEHLRHALGESRGGAVSEFFNSEWEARLHEHDLFLSGSDVSGLSDEVMLLMREFRGLATEEGQAPNPESQERQDVIRQRMNDIEAILQRPTFELGGRINIRSRILRDEGPDHPTKVSNVISLADPGAPLGVVYEEFPFPARMVAGEILIAYDRIEILQDLVLQGVAGGRAVISGRVDRVREPVRRLEPNLAIHAEQIPINEFLLRAIPDRDWNSLEPGASTPLSKGAEIVGGLNITGTVSAQGTVFADERGKAAFDIDVRLLEGRTRLDGEPTPARAALDWIWPASLPLEGVAAHLTVHRRSVDIHQFAGASGMQEFTARGEVDWSVGSTALDLHVDGTELDLQPHLIELASAVGRDGGVDEMRRFWDRFEPQGTADASLVYRQSESGETGFDLTLRPHDGSLVINDHRVAIANPQGAVRITPGVASFTDLVVDASCGGVPAGRIHLGGALAWDPQFATGLDAKVEAGRFEAPIFDVFADGISRLLTKDNAAASEPTGLFDASLSYTRAIGENAPSYLVNLQPKSLDLTLGGQAFEIRRVSGSALVSPESVELSNLFGSYQDGLIRLGGAVNRGDDIDAKLRLSVSADKLTDRVRALLPRPANQLIDAIDLHVGQSVELNDADIHYTRKAAPRGATENVETLRFDGLLNVRDASMNLSIPITELDGSLHLQAERRSDEPWLHGNVAMNVSRMLVFGRLVTDVEVDLVAGEQPGLVHVPRIVGDCYGGRLSAEGHIEVPWQEQPGRYDLELSLAQVAVEPVLRRFAPRRPPDEDAAERPSATDAPPPAVARRPGRLEAGLSIAGTFGDPASRIGRGEIRVKDAELYEVPLAMWALQLSALTLPVSTSFREAEIGYYVEGNEVVFERLLLDSPAMSLVGGGVLNYESKALDMTFNTASKLRAPLLTPLWEGLRDLFMSIRVTGTLESPLAKLQPHAASRTPGARPARSAAAGREEDVIIPARN